MARVPITTTMSLRHPNMVRSLYDWCWSSPDTRQTWRREAQHAKIRARDPLDPGRRDAEALARSNAITATRGKPCL